MLHRNQQYERTKIINETNNRRNDFNDLDSDIKCQWECTAKFVLRRELEVEIAMLNLFPTGNFNSTPYKYELIKVLEAQLTELQGDA